MATPSLLQWMDSFESIDRLNFSVYGLGFLFPLREIPINFFFLRAAASFWDPHLHVFRFNRVEMCPASEDFVAVMGHTDRDT